MHSLIHMIVVAWQRKKNSSARGMNWTSNIRKASRVLIQPESSQPCG